MADLTLKHIYKMYPNGAKAVNDFNMEITDGEFIVFVGPSGCGKSTTLRMIAGLEDITAGELTIGGVAANDIPPQDRDIAMVFQSYALYPNMNVYENMAFGLEMQRLPKDEIKRKVKEAAEKLGITEYLDRKPREMSGGQRQRVALGRAIVRNPQVMLLDEPLSNLDAKLRTQMRSELVKLHSELQTTFIYVTHDQTEAMTMGSRIVVMKDGYTQQIDTPTNLYRYPANKFVAGFIGTPQMNFLDGTLKKMGEEVEIELTESGAKLVVPYSYFYKVHPKYLNGDVPILIGFRAEDLSLPVEGEKIVAPLQIRGLFKEILGAETLVHGNIIGENGNDSDGTQIIMKIQTADDPTDYQNRVFTAALNLNKIHLFDKDTEESIMPRVPKYNVLGCAVGNGVLHFLGQEIALPPALRGGEGADELLIPTDAITEGGSIAAKVKHTEAIGRSTLHEMELGGRILYAITDNKAEQTFKIALDMKRLSLRKNGEEVVTPLPSKVRFEGTFKKGDKVKRKPTEKKNIFVRFADAVHDFFRARKYEYLLGIEDWNIAAPENVATKLIGLLSARGALASNYFFECSPYDITIGEQGISAQVVQICDYGTEKFAQCQVGEKTIFVKVDEPIEGAVKLVLAVDKLSIIQKEKDIRII